MSTSFYSDGGSLSGHAVKNTPENYENQTKECIWSYVNLLQYKRRKRSAYFGHFLYPSLGKFDSKDIFNIPSIYPSYQTSLQNIFIT
jgi:hypothetical protein